MNTIHGQSEGEKFSAHLKRVGHRKFEGAVSQRFNDGKRRTYRVRATLGTHGLCFSGSVPAEEICVALDAVAKDLEAQDA